jgi:hypothetical protein
MAFIQAIQFALQAMKHLPQLTLELKSHTRELQVLHSRRLALLMLLITFVLLVTNVQATITIAAQTVTPTPGGCTNGATSCTFAFAPTGHGVSHAYFVGMSYGGIGQKTISSVTDNVGNTYVKVPSSSCTSYFTSYANGGSIDCMIVVAPTGTPTSVTVNSSSGGGNFVWQCAAVDITTNFSYLAFVNAANAVTTTPSNTWAGAQVNVGIGSYAIIQWTQGGPGASSTLTTVPPGTNYQANGPIASGHSVLAIATNTNVTTPPVFNSTGNLISLSATGAVAFGEFQGPQPSGNPQVGITGGVKITGGVNFGSISVPITILSTSPIPNCAQGVPYEYQFNVVGGVAPYTWSVSAGALQNGLALDVNGNLAGTCTANSGTATFTIQVKDSAKNPNTISKVFQQTAVLSGPALAFSTTPAPPSPSVSGAYYQYDFVGNVSGGQAPYLFSLVSGFYPTGLTLTQGGYLSGFANGSQSNQVTYTFTLQVTDNLSNTAQTSFTIIITPSLAASQIANEPQHWVSLYMGGVNKFTGNPCAQSDASGTCTNNLPKTCNAGNHCTHEQLGFGTNDHPATLAGLYAAGCDWVALGQNWYMWVEVPKGSQLTGSSATNQNNAVYNMPVKYDGVIMQSYAGATCGASTGVAPYGVWSQPGTMIGTLSLGEIVTQATTGATAMVTCVPGTDCYCPPNGVSCNYTGANQNNLQIDSITSSSIGNGATADGTHVWTGQTTGATFTPSGVPVANGFFRVTAQCSAGAGSDTPCNSLTDKVPCFQSAIDASAVNNPICTSPNDVGSMFSIVATTPGNTGSGTIVEQDGSNTFLSGVEVTLAVGSNQSVNATLCNGYNLGFCTAANNAWRAKCGNCGGDHFWTHGWDPGDPGQLAFAQSTVNSAGGTKLVYPVDPSLTQYNCPSWIYNTNAAVDNNGNSLNPNSLPFTLTGNFAPFANGCGDDLIFGLNVIPAGPFVYEHFTCNKIHLNSTESHCVQIGTGQNATPAYPLPFGTLPGPGKLVDFWASDASIQVFEGNPIWQGFELRRFRASMNPGHRFLSGGASNSPAATNVFPMAYPFANPLYGCNMTVNGKKNEGCPMTWAHKKCLEIKKAQNTMYDGFIVEHMLPDGQSGECLDLSINVTSGGPNLGILDTNYLPMVPGNDVRYTNFIERQVSGGMGDRARSGTQTNGGGTSQGQNRTYINNGLIYAMDVIQWGNGSGATIQKYGASNQGDVGNSRLCPVISRDANGVTTAQCTVSPITPTFISKVEFCATAVSCLDSDGKVASLVFQFEGQRQDPINAANTSNTLSAVSEVSYGYFTFTAPKVGSSVCDFTDPAGGCYDANFVALLASTNIDCRQLPCVTGQPINPYAPTQTKGIFAPVCSADNTNTIGNWPSGQPGVGDTQLIIGRACHNCGVTGDQQCPDFGQTTVGPASTYTSSVTCQSTGGCGPANVQFPSWAFSTMDISPADITIVSGCTNKSFNTPTQPITPNTYACSVGVQNLAQGNCATNYATCAVNQNAGSLNVVYPQCPAAGSASSSSETCTISNVPGWQTNFITNHISYYSANIGFFSMTPFGYPSQSRQNQITNSIFYFGPNGKGLQCGGGSCTGKEANQGAYQTMDQASNAIHHNVFVLPTAARGALYTFVGPPNLAGMCSGGPTPGNCTNYLFGAVNIPISTTCTSGTNGQSLDANGVPLCIGLSGYLSIASWPTSDCTSSTYSACPWASPPYGTFDYHNFALCTGCATSHAIGNDTGIANYFKYWATDGLMIGPCISGNCTDQYGNNTTFSSIDNAMTRTLYVCTGPCGTGPWPD